MGDHTRNVRILVTNDDGYDAPGLRVLVETARRMGSEVLVVAPYEEQSYMGHRVTTREPLAVKEYARGEFHVTGTPADCVRVALRGMGFAADWVFSGVNRGGNLGSDIYTSGTVAAAREAAFLGVPAVALSQYVYGPWTLDWAATQTLAARMLAEVTRREAAPGTYWNVNFPHPPAGADLAAIEWVECKPDANAQDVRFEPHECGYVYCGRYRERPRSEQRDVEHCFGGAITLSRLTVEHA